MDDWARAKRILLCTEDGVILERNSSSPLWFPSRWPKMQRALAAHTGGAE